MILIAHRGNTNGPNPKIENRPEYIQKALDEGFHVEIDVWLQSDGLFLGHDRPQYSTELEFLKQDDRIICHAKTVNTFQFLISNGLHCFFHDKDQATLTSQNKIWLYPGVAPCSLGILVMPEWPSIDYGIKNWIEFVVEHRESCYGVCSDYVELIKKQILSSRVS